MFLHHAPALWPSTVRGWTWSTPATAMSGGHIIDEDCGRVLDGGKSAALLDSLETLGAVMFGAARDDADQVGAVHPGTLSNRTSMDGLGLRVWGNRYSFRDPVFPVLIISKSITPFSNSLLRFDSFRSTKNITKKARSPQGNNGLFVEIIAETRCAGAKRVYRLSQIVMMLRCSGAG